MGTIDDDVKCGLSLIEFCSLIDGETLLFARVTGDNPVIAEVTLEECLYDEGRCRVKVRKILKQNADKSGVAVGDVLTAGLYELVKV